MIPVWQPEVRRSGQKAPQNARYSHSSFVIRHYFLDELPNIRQF
jgi:hypothetical protein